MGLCLGSIGSSIACCFGNAFCSLCCASCPACKGSTSTRIGYGLFLLVGLIVSCVMLIPGLDKILSQIPWFCRGVSLTNNHIHASLDCSNIVGSLAVYRLYFGMTVFFLIFCILMLKVKSSNDVRAKIHNGFWAFKLLLLVSLIVGAFFIPHNLFDTIFMFVGLIGGFLFILIQLLLFVDFVHCWNESWVDQVESGSKKHGYGLLFFTFFFYALTITGNALLYIYYASDRSNCQLHLFFISFNLFLCLILSIISILPNVRKYNSSCGLLQSSFVSLYVVYFTWSAMSSNPDRRCNPKTNLNSPADQNLLEPITIIGLILFVCSIFYSILTTSRNSRARKLFFSFSASSSVDSTILDDAQIVNSVSDKKWILGSEEQNHQRVYNDERGSVTYNYSLFHLMFVLGILYAMVTLTNWYDPAKDFSTYNHSFAAVWVKIVSSWLCMILYIWTCIAPTIFPDRDFS